MNKKLIVSVLLGAVGLTSVFGFSKVFGGWFGETTIDTPLTSFRYGSGGDMQGSHHSIAVKSLDKDSVLVTYSDADWHYEDPEIKEYKVAPALLKDIHTAFNKYKMVRCEKAPKAKVQVLDGATDSYTFYFDKRNVHFGSTQEISTETYKGLREIFNIIGTHCKQGQKLPALVTPPRNPEVMVNPHEAEQGKLLLKVYGYEHLLLHVRFLNGLGKEQKLMYSYQLISKNAPEIVLEEHSATKELSLNTYGDSEYSIKLKQDLQPGKYVFTLAGYTTEFEIK